MKAKITAITLVLIVSLGSAIGTEAQSPSATLSSGSGSGMAGDTGIPIPVSLNSDPGTQVSGLNFDLTFDSSRLSVSNVSIGPAASSAGKSLSYSIPSPGRVRVIIISMGQTAIPNGTVANIIFDISASASAGTSALSLSNAIATDPDGDSVPLSLSNGSFTVTAPPPASTPVPTNTNTPTNTTQPSIPSTATSTHTPTSTQASSASATNTPTLPATYTPTTSGLSSATIAPTGSSTTESSPTPLDFDGGSPLEMEGTLAPDEAVSKEMAQSIEMSIMATMTALEEIDSQVAATGTALAMSAGDLNEAASDSESRGGSIFSNPLIWLAIIGISSGVVAITIFATRTVRKGRRGSNR